MEENIGDAIGANLNEILRANELEKSLTDERIKAEEYKTNYETLKIDYMRFEVLKRINFMLKNMFSNIDYSRSMPAL